MCKVIELGPKVQLGDFPGFGIEEISSWKEKIEGVEGCVPWPRQNSIVLIFDCHSFNYTLELLGFVIAYLFRKDLFLYMQLPCDRASRY